MLKGLLLPKKKEYDCANCQDKGVIDNTGNPCVVCGIAETALCKNCNKTWAYHTGIQCNYSKNTTYEPKKKPKCFFCHDTGHWKNNWGVKSYCKCTYTCTICSNKGYIDDYGDKVPCSCVFSSTYKETLAAKEAKQAEKKAKGLAIVGPEGEPQYFGGGFVLDNTKEEAIEEKVKSKGVDLDIVVAEKDQLMIDYDSEEIPEQFHKMLPILRHRFNKGVIMWKKQRSASGKHWHVIVTLPEDISDQERILWQAVFGSDYMREGLSILRVAAGMEDPTLLFVPKNVEVVETGMLEAKPARKFKDA